MTRCLIKGLYTLLKGKIPYILLLLLKNHNQDIKLFASVD